jgi:hypothetical protein
MRQRDGPNVLGHVERVFPRVNDEEALKLQVGQSRPHGRRTGGCVESSDRLYLENWQMTIEISRCLIDQKPGQNDFAIPLTRQSQEKPAARKDGPDRSPQREERLEILPR